MPFIELQTVDSTNNYALSHIYANLATPGTSYFAHAQLEGKGQWGKTWVTEKGANIILSIVLKPEFLSHFQQFQLSACIAVSTHAFFSKYAGDETMIKWPNDIYWRNRKAGGILIESRIGSASAKASATTWEWAVAGIGLNINQTQFPEPLTNAVSLKQITGKSFDTVQMAKELCKSIEHYYNQLGTGGFPEILKLYRQHLYKKNEKVQLKKLNRIFEATVIDVSEEGQLITLHGIEERFDFGEIEWITS